ncbi:hypothetical protein NDU88_002943 [Pleurodeles waltl]|uniref:Uncharacterized protein n=1 Tax=Pleurodeles waltl TaxID=8319 RepID=A0AAV7LFK2_PLEWA|nr:hypothetical protein NDU88_002943 [Pleurodeles waltl]
MCRAALRGRERDPDRNLAINKPRKLPQTRSQHRRSPEQNSEQWRHSRTKRDEEQRRERIGAEPRGLKIQGGICTWERGHIETPRTRRRRHPLGAPVPTRLGTCSLDWDLSEQARSIRGLERDRGPDPENPSDQPPGDRRDGNGNGGAN